MEQFNIPPHTRLIDLTIGDMQRAMMQVVQQALPQPKPVKEFRANGKSFTVTDDEMVDRKTALEMTGVHTATFSVWLSKGYIKKYGVGQKCKYKVSELMAAPKYARKRNCVTA